MPITLPYNNKPESYPDKFENLDQDITRIDLERDGQHVNLSYWFYGWVQGFSSPKAFAYAVETNIEMLLTKFKRQGFTVWMMDGVTGRALRGLTTRIDFICIEGQMHIRKYPYGWTALTPPISDEIKTTQECEAAIRWCNENGWTVHRWQSGGRAWKGPLLPVRDHATIKLIRKQLADKRSRGEADERNQANLAFDW